MSARAGPANDRRLRTTKSDTRAQVHYYLLRSIAITREPSPSAWRAKALGATASSNGWRGAKDEGVAETAEASARYETESVGASISTMAADRITP